MKIIFAIGLLALLAVTICGQCTQYTYKNRRCVDPCRADGDGKYQCLISGGYHDYCSPSEGVTVSNEPCVSTCAKKVSLAGESYECTVASGTSEYCGVCYSRPAP